MKKITLLIAFMLAFLSGYGQSVANYTFSQSTGNAYTEITGGTSVVSCTDCTTSYDTSSYVITLPTAFPFNGTTVTSVVMRVDGSLLLGATSTSSSTSPISSTATGTGVVSPLGMDLRSSTVAGTTFDLSWIDNGTEYVFQWKNASRWAQNTIEKLNFQVKINKTTGVINLAYGTMTAADSTGYQPQVGLRGLASSDYNARSLTATVPDATPSWDDTALATSNSATVRFTTGTPAAIPASGLVYTFTPPAACTGTPLAGTISGDAIRYVCTGVAPAAITVTGAAPVVPGITFQWEQSTNGTDWVNAVGGSGATTLTYTPPSFGGTTIMYRLKTTCATSSESAFSTAVTVNLTQSPATQSSALTVSTTSATAFNLAWTSGNGTRRLVYVSTSPITDPVNANGIAAYTATAVFANTGQQIVYDGTGSSVNVTGLTCNTTYYVKVFDYSRCGSGPYDVYFNTTTDTNTLSVTTGPLTTTLPATNNFTGFTGANLPAAVAGWYEAAIPTTSGAVPTSSNPVGNSSGWLSSTALGATTAKFNLYIDTGNAWIISPKMAITANSRLKFKAAITDYNGSGADPERMVGTDDKVNVLVSTDGCGAVWTPIYTFNAANTTTLTNVLTDYTLALNAYVGQTVQIAFQATDGPVNEAPDYDFHIGNIVVELTPDCDVPALLATTNITKNTATLNWTAPTVGTPTGYQYVVSTTNTTPVAAGTAVTGTTVNVASLLPSTTYYVFVRTVCSGDFSDWSVAGIFTTMCDYPEVASVTGGSVCGMGSATLAATSAGTIRWFANQTGGNALASGASFTTPQISATTTYYVEAATEGMQVSGGKAAPAADATTSTSNNYGIVFNVAQATKLEAVSVYSTAAGTVDIKVMNAAMTTELYSTGNVAVTAGGTTTPNVIPLNVEVPAGTGYRIVVKAYSGASLVRDSAGLTFPYTSADGNLTVTSSEWGGTTTLYYYYFYDIKYKTICSSPRQAVVATVTAAPAITATASDASICAGESTNLSVTSENATYTYVWMPGNLTGATQAVTPVASTTYTVTATDAGSGCVITQTVAVTVNPLPSAIVITPAAPETCANTVQALTVTGGIIPTPGPIGTATTLTGTTEQPTAFCNRWPNYWSQTIYTAAELTAAGLTAGNITSMAYNITTLGDAATNANFTVKIGTTSSANFATNDFMSTTAMATVYGPATYTHTESGWQVITFATPYSWDGTSNIIVNVTYDGADDLYNSQTYYTETATNTVLWRNSYSASTTTGTLSPKRLNVTFTSANPTATVISWSPAENLYTNAAATTPYVAGANATTVYFKSATAGTNAYTVTSTSTPGCTRTGTVSVTVNLTDAPAADATQTFCNTATVAGLTTTGGTAVQWYTAATGGTALAATAALTDDTVYYASQTLNGCESALRTPVTVQINVTPVPTVAATQTFCNAATIANLVATEAGVQWYAAATGGTALTPDTALVNGTVYYASQILNNCESVRAAVTAQVNVTPAPAAAEAQLFCTSGTVNNLLATGTNIQWYTAATGGTALAVDTALATGTTYYASQTIDGCEGMTRTAVTVTITTTVADAPEDVTECGSYVLPALISGSYYTATGGTGTMLAAGTEIEETTIIYVYAQSGTTPNCTDENAFTVTINNSVADAPEDVTSCNVYVLPALVNGSYYTGTNGTGTMLAVGTPIEQTTDIYVYAQSNTTPNCTAENMFTVTITTVDAPTGAATQTVEVATGENATIADLIVETEGTVTWYASEADALAGVNPLTDASVITTGATYYATQTVGNCTSTTVLAVMVDVVLGRDVFDVNAFTYYPNPVNNVLNLSYSSNITSVSVFNLVGQQIMQLTPNASDVKVDMSALAEGTYIVNVGTGNTVKTIKVVKKQ